VWLFSCFKKINTNIHVVLEKQIIVLFNKYAVAVHPGRNCLVDISFITRSMFFVIYVRTRLILQSIYQFLNLLLFLEVWATLCLNHLVCALI